ncbi:ArsR/SmtB family transcription factor [Actinokineospora xionganensis]|uniref:Helix-turn-helix transcriptional regulator n=1 Tax=Actinokineospora xionganensis TaxID=2684470 RepID=A0ABR7LD47_9PSEU|nr:helix-turn-helix domain-containing protein [Actinokineospora xionganensis]MBC6450640.1 helix-turn-helix transcriptional regulator [Actinokineospora xionganensis]
MGQPTYHHMNVEGLKVLAHPMRVRLLGLLRTHGPATASGLAQRLGESSGTTSWHLRQLADAGFIEEDTERGNRRERWWRAAQDHTELRERSLPEDDPEVRDALVAYMSNILDGYRDRAVGFVRSRHTWDEPWRHTSSMSDWLLPMGAEEAQRFLAEIETVVERYRRPAAEGDQAFAVQFQAFPIEAEQ